MVLKQPWIESLPYLVQLLIIDELKITEKKAKECDDDDGRELLDKISCSYSFY